MDLNNKNKAPPFDLVPQFRGSQRAPLLFPRCPQSVALRVLRNVPLWPPGHVSQVLSLGD